MQVIPTPHEQHIPSGENVAKIILFFVLLAITFYLTDLAVRWLQQSGLPVWISIIIIWIAAIWNSILILSLGILGHEAVHRSLFRSPFWNDTIGGFIIAFGLLPFYTHRYFHLTHHTHTHKRGVDPENFMHDRSFWTGFIGSFVGLRVHYQIFCRNLMKIGNPHYAWQLGKDSIFMANAAWVYFWLIPSFGISLNTTVIPMSIAFWVVNWWRAVSDHYGIPAIEPHIKNSSGTRGDLRISPPIITGWVVLTHPWLEWLWSHVNYHEVHHRYPWVSHRYLPRIFSLTRESQPYAITSGYWRSLLNLSDKHYYGRENDLRRFLQIPVR